MHGFRVILQKPLAYMHCEFFRGFNDRTRPAHLCNFDRLSRPFKTRSDISIHAK